MAARHTHPTYDWWRLPSGEASLSLYNAGRLRVPIVESLDWTIVEVTLGPDSQRLVHGPCELKCCERTPEDKTYDIYLARGRVQREGLRCGISGKLGLGQRSRVTERSPTGRLTLWDQREAGTWVHRLRKEARSGTTEGVQREGLHCGINGKLGLGCTDLGRTVL